LNTLHFLLNKLKTVGIETHIQQLPKIELHLHLDCSLSFQVVSRIDPSVTRSYYESEFQAPPKCTNLADFLRSAQKGIDLMQSEHELRLVTSDLFEQLVKDHVIYAEIRFAPLLHTQKGLSPEEVVEIVDDEIMKASEATGVEARLILCTLRHFTEEQSLETVKLVERFRHRMVVALDIAADEAGFPVDAHIPAFQFGVEKKIPRIAHAGEARGADSVWETLKYFRPSRIGHGVRSIEDSKLIQHLRTHRIHLEICPTCNVQTNIFDTYNDHAIKQLYGLGVSLGINTDARTLSNVTITEEYEKLHRAFGWNKEHFLRCNLSALEASFMPHSMKKHFSERLLGAYSS
jgi:adenosine deaminase